MLCECVFDNDCEDDRDAEPVTVLERVDDCVREPEGVWDCVWLGELDWEGDCVVEAVSEQLGEKVCVLLDDPLRVSVADWLGVRVALGVWVAL